MNARAWTAWLLPHLALSLAACGGSERSDATPAGGSDTVPLPSEGCGSTVLAPGSTVLHLTHANLDRQYTLHTPVGFTGKKPVSLIVNMHGFTSNKEQQEAYSGMTPKSDAEGYLVAYPDGVSNAWAAGACCALNDAADDVGFIKAVVADVAAKSCVDLRRVYATGVSNGGSMAHRLACEAADVFAAVAPVSSLNGMTNCAPSRPISLMSFNGTADPIADYNSQIVPSIQAWADRNGCVDGSPKVTFQNGATTCETWSQCSAGVEVTECRSEGEGHCWPGTPLCTLGAYTLDINADDEMWKMFQRHLLPL